MSNSKEEKTSRFVMGYKLPSGIIEKKDSDHPVLGGWLSQDTWDKIRSDKENEVSTEDQESFNKWRLNYQNSEVQKKRVDKDVNALTEWIKNKLSNDPNLICPLSMQSNEITTTFFGIQCFLMKMLPQLSRRPSWMSVKDWVENELGLNSIDALYPVVTSDGRLFQLDDLIFDFGYGPNYFDWTKQKPYKLKGTPTNLYLICMDVGKISNGDSLKTYKIGITQKEVIGTSSKNSRFYGNVGENIRVIRLKHYKDGRDAYMIEQTIIKMSRQESSNDTSRLSYDCEVKLCKIWESIDDETRNRLGVTEWVFPSKTEDEIVSIYERMTSYGEFHGDGNLAYSPFSRDYEKH